MSTPQTIGLYITALYRNQYVWIQTVVRHNCWNRIYSNIITVLRYLIVLTISNILTILRESKWNLSDIIRIYLF